MIANIIGFTGTQDGISVPQWHLLETLISCIEFSEFHHGDCKGADEQSHNMLWRVGFNNIVIHPPDNPAKRVFIKNVCPSENYLHMPEKPYLERNKDIVDVSDLLIACPSGDEVIRSGTWSTVRYARKMNKTIFIIQPSGLLTVEVS